MRKSKLFAMLATVPEAFSATAGGEWRTDVRRLRDRPADVSNEVAVVRIGLVGFVLRSFCVLRWLW